MTGSGRKLVSIMLSGAIAVSGATGAVALQALAPSGAGGMHQAVASTLEAQVEDAQTQVTALKPAYKAAKELKARGSVGFFEHVGAQDAIEALRTCGYADYVKADDVDATSLDNMEESFAHLAYHNKLRKKLGLSELKVTDAMMAYAQADADYSDKHIEHASQFDIAENLAWNFGTNPYLQWYDGEKAVYDAAKKAKWGKAGNENAWLDENFGKVGHYLNVIEPSYETTGFAVCTRNTKGWTTYGQVFDWDDGSTDAYTLTEYQERFNEYYAPIKADIGAYKDAVAKCKSLEKKLYTPAKVKISKLTGSKGKIQIQWGKVKNNAAGYAVRYSKSKYMTGSKTKDVKAGKSQLKISGLKAGTRYYVQVRAYNNAGGKTWTGTWSKKKSVTTK